jgi:hypothetical protein
MDIKHGTQSLMQVALLFELFGARMARGANGGRSIKSLFREAGTTTHGHKASKFLLENTSQKTVEVFGTNGVHDVQKSYWLHNREAR